MLDIESATLRRKMISRAKSIQEKKDKGLKLKPPTPKQLDVAKISYKTIVNNKTLTEFDDE